MKVWKTTFASCVPCVKYCSLKMCQKRNPKNWWKTGENWRRERLGESRKNWGILNGGGKAVVKQLLPGLCQDIELYFRDRQPQQLVEKLPPFGEGGGQYYDIQQLIIFSILTLFSRKFKSNNVQSWIRLWQTNVKTLTVSKFEWGIFSTHQVDCRANKNNKIRYFTPPVDLFLKGFIIFFCLEFLQAHIGVLICAI